MYFGRVEECGIRCQYHGWKFDVSGTLVELPTERTGSRAEQHIMDTVAIRAYPCHEVNHMIWVYLGEGDPPPFPPFEISTIPESQVLVPAVMMEQANWLQNLEGDLDSVHLNWLHRRLAADSPAPAGGHAGLLEPRPRGAGPRRRAHRVRRLLQQPAGVGRRPDVAPDQPVHLPLPHHDQRRPR